MTEAEIASMMNWRGPGAYTAGAMRRVKAVVAEAVRREREECVCVAETVASGRDAEAIVDAIRARGNA